MKTTKLLTLLLTVVMLFTSCLGKKQEPTSTETNAPAKEPEIIEYVADIGLNKTINGRFFIAAYHNETGKLYAVESEPSSTWSPDWPGNWVAGFTHPEYEGTFYMAVTQRPEGPGVFDMYPTNNGEFASVVGFEAPVDGKYSPEIKLERIGSERDAYVRLMKSDGTVLQEITGPKRGEAFTLSATDVELSSGEQLWLVVDKAAHETDIGGYNVSFISFTVIGPEVNVPDVNAPEIFIPDSDTVETNAPETDPPKTEPNYTLKESVDDAYRNNVEFTRRYYFDEAIDANRWFFDVYLTKCLGYSDKDANDLKWRAHGLLTENKDGWTSIPAEIEHEDLYEKSLPTIYEEIIWFNENIGTITKEQFENHLAKLVSDGIMESDHILNDPTVIEALFSDDIDAVKKAFKYPTAYMIDGANYSLLEIIRGKYPSIRSLTPEKIMTLKGDLEFLEFIEFIETYDGLTNIERFDALAGLNAIYETGETIYK